MDNKLDWFWSFFLEKSLSQVLGHIKLHKKGSRNIIFSFYLRKLSRFRGKFLAIFGIKVSTTNAVLENWR